MRLSRTATYAIRALVQMAREKHDENVIGHELAKKLRLPQGFLLRLLVALARARILLSVKGPNGGYRLARPANKISLLEVIEAVEGRLDGRVRAITEDTRLDRRLAAIFEQAAERARRQFRAVHLAELAGKKT